MGDLRKIFSRDGSAYGVQVEGHTGHAVAINDDRMTGTFSGLVVGGLGGRSEGLLYVHLP